jgi:c-di-GMP-binding flagellar brake protein YcgR
MFESGKVYKVKVETNPGEAGFGRATIIERSGTQMMVQLRTSRDANAVFPKGTRIWFVSDSPDNTFNGLWASTVIGAQLQAGKTIMVCAPPRLEPLLQRRRTPRVTLEVPVRVSIGGEQLKQDVRSKDISRSGIALESAQPLPHTVDPGEHIDLVVQTNVGDIAVSARVIRVERNWLASKTTVGLEFTDMQKDAVETLDKLLVLLGGRPRNPDEAAGSESGTKTGLSAWMPSGAETRGKFVGGAQGEEPSSENQSPNESKDNQKE